MIVERIISDSETAIPSEVLHALGLKSGDTLAFDIDEDRVSLRRAGDLFDEEHPSIEAATGLSAETLRAMMNQAIDDPRPTASLEEGFERIKARLRQRWAAGDA